MADCFVGRSAVTPTLGTPTRISPFGAYELTWSEDGTRLVAWSCGGRECLSQVLDPATQRVRLVDTPGLGSLIGLVGETVVSFGACEGPPCPVVAVGPDGSFETLVPSATGAVLARIGAVGQLVYQGDASGLSTIGLGSGRRTLLPAVLAGGTSLLLPAAIAHAAVALPNGWLVAGPDGFLRSSDVGAPVPVLIRMAGSAVVELGVLK